jgi:hypothetical protein
VCRRRTTAPRRAPWPGGRAARALYASAGAAWGRPMP